MKKNILLAVIILLGAAVYSPTTWADQLILEYNYEFSEGTAPQGAPPWLTATFEDITGGVQLTLSTSGLTGTEFVSEWDFNFDPAQDPTAVISDFNWVSGPWKQTNLGSDAYAADGGGYYDIEITFHTNAAYRFGAGETAVFQFLGDGLTVDDFNYLASPHGGHGVYLSAAHVQGIQVPDADGDYSGWIAGYVPVPEPAAILLLGLGLVGLAGLGLNRKFHQ